MPHRLSVLAKQAGLRGLYAGLGPRMVMSAGLVSGQFLMYGIIKDGVSFLNHRNAGTHSPPPNSIECTVGAGDSQGVIHIIENFFSRKLEIFWIIV